ncbi:unnamed protein product [Lymnaea stagnalis]|uniref:G-protein coupled receptors family 1 profile domain-containing protein n=1 Tax=Lymnaea stagnalis TaxID=6523 RepID=A0AAV2HMK6_LYMST
MDKGILLSGNSSVSSMPELLNTNQMKAVAILSLMTSCLSFIGSGSVFTCAIYHGRVCYPEIFPTFHLALADMLASLFLVTSSAIFLNNLGSGMINFPGSSGPCGYLMTLVTSAYTAAFLLTITYAMEALFRFRQRLKDGTNLDLLAVKAVSNKWMYLAYILAWVVPVCSAIGVMIVTHNLRDTDDFDIPVHILSAQCSSCFANFRFSEEYCWNQVEDGETWHKFIKLIFVVPLLLVVILNMMFYILITKVFKLVAMRRGLLSYHQRQEETLLKKKAMLYQGVFFVCWLPSVILGIVSFIDSYTMKTFFWLLIIQAILGPLQGLLNSIVYGWKRDGFRRALSETSSLLSTNRATAMSVTL